MSPDLFNLKAGLPEQFDPVFLGTLDASLHEHVQVHEKRERVRSRSGSRWKNHFANEHARSRSHGVHNGAQDPLASLVVVVVQHIAQVVDVCI